MASPALAKQWQICTREHTRDRWIFSGVVSPFLAQRWLSCAMSCRVFLCGCIRSVADGNAGTVQNRMVSMISPLPGHFLHGSHVFCQDVTYTEHVSLATMWSMSMVFPLPERDLHGSYSLSWPLRRCRKECKRRRPAVELRGCVQIHSSLGQYGYFGCRKICKK